MKWVWKKQSVPQQNKEGKSQVFPRKSTTQEKWEWFNF